MDKNFETEMIAVLQDREGVAISEASVAQINRAIATVALKRLKPAWQSPPAGKRACYLSAEFLLGRLTESNLFNMGLLRDVEEILKSYGADIRMLEQIRDPALGNGGLGRLAACFLDAAATQNIPLDGYGIRYRYGLFRQAIRDGFQKELADDWLAWGDPWSIRHEDEKIKITFGDQVVWAVPYDMPIVGYGMQTVNTLRLWQAEAVGDFDFETFDSGRYAAAFTTRNAAETITAVLYPNDSTTAGKKLRLKQQYFFAAASLRDMIRRYKRAGGTDLRHMGDMFAIQLNDTHPVVAIPEFLRILTEEEQMSFADALQAAQKLFSYTNHTIMPEALEKWDVKLFQQTIPAVYPQVRALQQTLREQLSAKGVTDFNELDILADGQVHMARIALFAAHAVNGVAHLHTELLKTRVLTPWYRLYPERFYNITNGITQRRWLALANAELADIVTARIGDGWLKNLDELKRLREFADDGTMLEQLRFMRQKKKKQLAAYLEKTHGIVLRWDFMLDVQAKRLHEYKRQLMNILSVLDICFGIQDGEIQTFQPTAFIFAAKAAPAYTRAKGIIKLIHAVESYVQKDIRLTDKVQVIFIPDYSVSTAQKLIPAADISEQISTAGTEASGTGNMKFMLNGALTLGTYDGANIEIVQQAGRENNFIFGATVEELEKLKANYDPMRLIKKNLRLKRVTDALIDGTLDDSGSGMFADLYRSLTQPQDGGDQYYVLGDFEAYRTARLEANQAYMQSETFAQKGLLNIAAAGPFSADRAIEQYAREIWGI